ncbi:MAG: hypothetical protein ACKVZ6_04555 [Kineosporiaceae bacterium]
MQDLQRAYGVNFPGLDQWTEADVRRMNALPTGGTHFNLTVPRDAHELLEVNHELASRIVTLCVVTAIDAYYLMRRGGYEEQIDQAMEIAGVGADDWPSDLALEPDLVVDPAYHLLHSAKRQGRRGHGDVAVHDLRQACLHLIGRAAAHDNLDLATLLLSCRDHPRTSAHHRKALFEAVVALPADYWLRDPLLTALTTPKVLPIPEDEDRTPKGHDQAEVEIVVVQADQQKQRPVPRGEQPPGRVSWTSRANEDPIGND